MRLCALPPIIEKPMTDQQLRRGDVVAYAGRYFVVWSQQPSAVEAFPISLGRTRRGEPGTVEIGNELASWNVSRPLARVLAGERETLLPAPTLRILRVGRCSGGLICRIVGAAARAYAAQFIDLHGRRECNNNSDTTPALTTAE